MNGTVTADVDGMRCTFNGERWRCAADPALAEWLDKWLEMVTLHHMTFDEIAERCLEAAHVNWRIIEVDLKPDQDEEPVDGIP